MKKAGKIAITAIIVIAVIVPVCLVFIFKGRHSNPEINTGTYTTARYRDVLLGNSPFRYMNEDGSSDAVTIADFMKTEGEYSEISDFTNIDSDGNGEDEIVLRIINPAGDMGGYLVLHKHNDEVYGYRFNNRTFRELKTDGTFTYSEAAGTEDGVAYVIFENDKCRVVKRLSAKGEMFDFDEFTVNDRTVSAEEYDTALNEQAQKQNAEWVEFSEENVSKILS